jgi:mannose-6-phosphate isomerase-like protein (cupin superfamily)
MARLSQPTDVVNLAEKFEQFDDRWSPKIAARINDLDLKLVKVEGEFVWHRHAETDEFFLVHQGHLTIELPDRQVVLGPGDCFVVPRGTEHRPRADQVCEIVLLEPVGTVNTGDAAGALTSAEDPWV